MRSVRVLSRETGFKMGIELEVNIANVPEARAAVPWFEYGSDPSVRSDFGSPAELRTPVLHFGTLDKPHQELTKLKNEVRVGVNETCGTHIHISFARTVIPIYNLIDTFGAAELLFYALGGRRGKTRINGRNRFARPVKARKFTLSPLNTVGNKSRSVHVYGNNPLHLEIRAFAGTANPSKLVLYQAAVLGVAMAAYRNEINKYRVKEDGMLLPNEIFHNVDTSLNTWLKILDWKEGGKWRGFWYNVRRPRNGMPGEEKLLKWLRKAIANFARVSNSDIENMEEAYKYADRLVVGGDHGH